jgi:hypothetical protein
MKQWLTFLLINTLIKLCSLDTIDPGVILVNTAPPLVPVTPDDLGLILINTGSTSTSGNSIDQGLILVNTGTNGGSSNQNDQGLILVDNIIPVVSPVPTLIFQTYNEAEASDAVNSTILVIANIT